MLNSCKNEKKPELFSYFQSTQEIINFCKAMVPCVKEEIQQAFKDQPQQREYLLSKTNHTNCQSEQSEKLNLMLNLTKEQTNSFLTELYQFQKEYYYANKQNQLDQFLKTHRYKIKSIDNQFSNLEAFLDANQKKILEEYSKCTEVLTKTTSCPEKKQILKNNPFCKNIFKE
jgi:septal ring factor EnvC (AmiA/AmiB activator)